jgi:hypothetical protein
MALYTHASPPMSFNFYIGISQILLKKELSKALDIDQPIIDLLHSYTIYFIFQKLRFLSWLISFNFKLFNQWIIKRNKIALNNLIHHKLNNELRNFSLFKSYESTKNLGQRKSLKDCSCQYYQKKHQRITKTNDFGLFRFKRATSITFILLFILSLCLIKRLFK